MKILLMLLLCLGAPVFSQIPVYSVSVRDDKHDVSSTSSTEVGDAANAFHRFLQGLNITLNDEDMPGQEKFGWAANIHSLSITEIDVQSIKSAREGSQLSIHINGFHARVDGIAKWTGWLWSGHQGYIHATINHTDARLAVTFGRTTAAGLDYPDKLEVNQCEIFPHFNYVQFDDRAAPAKIDGNTSPSRTGIVTSMLNWAVSTQVCPLVQKYVSEYGTEFIQPDKWRRRAQNFTRQINGTGAALPDDQGLQPRQNQSHFLDNKSMPLNVDEWMRFEGMPEAMWLDEVIRNDVGTTGVNWLMGVLVAAAGKAIAEEGLGFGGEFLDNVTQEKLFDWRVNISNLTIDGLDDFRQIRFPDLENAPNPNSFGFRITTGVLNSSANLDLHFAPTAKFGKNVVPIHSRVKVVAHISNLKVIAQMAMLFAIDRLGNQSSASALLPECILPALAKAHLSTFSVSFNVAEDTFVMTPIGNRSESLEGDIARLLDKGIELLSAEYQALPARGISYLTEPIIAALANKELDDILAGARNFYLSSSQVKEYNTTGLAHPTSQCLDTMSPSAVFFRSTSIILSSVACIVFFFSWQLWKPVIDVREASMGPIYRLPWKCLGAESSVPVMFTLTVPVVTLAILFAKMYSMSMVGSIVTVSLLRQGQAITLPPVMENTLEGTLQTMWDGGDTSTYITTFIMSGLVPYLKLVVLLCAWLLPTKFLSFRSRGKMLRVYNSLGKWAFGDFFMNVLMMVAQHVDMRFGSARVLVVVHPMKAWYIELFVTIFSTWLGYLMLAMHERVRCWYLTTTKEAPELGENSMGVHPTLQRMGATRRHSKLDQGLGTRQMLVETCASHPWFPNLVPFMLCSALMCFFIGIFSKVIRFQQHGLVRLLIANLGHGVVDKEIGPLSLAADLPHMADAPNGGQNPDLFILFAQLTFIFLVVVMEFLYMVMLLFAYLVPVNSIFRKSFLTFAHMLHAWAALDVFVLTIFAARFSLPKQTEIQMGNTCDPIESALEKYFYNLDGLDEFVCQRIDPQLSIGTWFLLASVLLSKPLGQLLMATLEKISDLSEETVEYDGEQQVGRRRIDSASGFELPPRSETKSEQLLDTNLSQTTEFALPSAPPVEY